MKKKKKYALRASKGVPCRKNRTPGKSISLLIGSPWLLSLNEGIVVFNTKIPTGGPNSNQCKSIGTCH